VSLRQPPILDYGHNGDPRPRRWWFDLPSLIAALIVGGAIFLGAKLTLELASQFKSYRHQLGTFITIVQAVSRWLVSGGWMALILFPLVVPFVVARRRRGAAPTVRSIRLTIRVTTLLLFLLALTLAASVGLEYASLIRSVSTTP
jgi:uncharacterized membrane protein